MYFENIYATQKLAKSFMPAPMAKKHLKYGWKIKQYFRILLFYAWKVVILWLYIAAEKLGKLERYWLPRIRQSLQKTKRAKPLLTTRLKNISLLFGISLY